MLGEARDHVEAEVAALELRIGVERDRQIDRIGDGAEILFDLRILEREIGFEDGKDAVDAELLIMPRLLDRIGVEVAPTPAITGTRRAAASTVAATIAARCSRLR